jgi:hypothetical protein
MRFRNPGVIGVAVLATLSTTLLSGCNLREGGSGEYGGTYGLSADNMISIQLPQEIPGHQDVRQF